MRCKNCGWENPANQPKCEKCNAPLNGSMIENNVPPRPSYSPIAESLKGTLREVGAETSGNSHQDAPASTPGACSHCGYPVSSTMNVCPQCGQTLASKPGNASPSPQAASNNCRQCGKSLPTDTKFCPYCGTPIQSASSYSRVRMGTVNAWEVPQQGTFCTLKPIAWRGEEVTYNPISYSGNVITLNRANTDPNNNTITSKEQAVLTREGDAWYIENRSEQHTTFIRVSKRTRLENGDVIVLGNRLFEFKD